MPGSSSEINKRRSCPSLAKNDHLLCFRYLPSALAPFLKLKNSTTARNKSTYIEIWPFIISKAATMAMMQWTVTNTNSLFFASISFTPTHI